MRDSDHRYLLPTLLPSSRRRPATAPAQLIECGRHAREGVVLPLQKKPPIEKIQSLQITRDFSGGQGGQSREKRLAGERKGEGGDAFAGREKNDDGERPSRCNRQQIYSRDRIRSAKWNFIAPSSASASSTTIQYAHKFQGKSV